MKTNFGDTYIRNLAKMEIASTDSNTLDETAVAAVTPGMLLSEAAENHPRKP
jgi:hypothetical protein